MNLEVTRKSIPEVLALLQNGEWQIPGFQREFVWSLQQVHDLLTSIFKGRPIGMVTAWAQPQGAPATEPRKVEVRGAEFGSFTVNPAVLKLILDGKQRLTSLAIAFGGLRTPKGSQLFSGSWFVDFTQDPLNSDEFVIYKRKAEVSNAGLEQLPNCLASGLLPLDRYATFNQVAQRIFDRDFYPQGRVPSNEQLSIRSTNLAACQATFNSYQIPVAELPSTVGLSDVCEIFEVLNTKGTKVSTFDLIHNTFFGRTAGQFSLRDTFEEIRSSTESLHLLLDPSRPEFFCQLVTGIYLSTESPTKRDGAVGENITSIKGRDLLETPLLIYQQIIENLPLLDSWARDFFVDILGIETRLEDLPYPASAILYFALRWRQSRAISPDKRFTIDQLNALFRAFFWRNILTNRYEQGFLTKFATDLGDLSKALDGAAQKSKEEWQIVAEAQIQAMFGIQYPARTETELGQLLGSEDVRGALWQALVLFLNASVRKDLLTGENLVRYGEPDANPVNLHHIFPKQWLKNNADTPQKSEAYMAGLTSLANLIPLSAKSNQDWGTKAPSAFFHQREIPADRVRDVLGSAYIDSENEALLKSESAEPPVIWGSRAQKMARAIRSLQELS